MINVQKYIKEPHLARVMLGLLLSALPLTALAQTSPPLGQSAAFAVLGGSAVTNTGNTNVTGELGVSPGTSVTGFPPGVVSGGSIHIADAVAAQAQADLVVAYNDLAGQAPTAVLTGTDLGGLTLGPGVYFFSSSAQLTGTLTLDAQGDPDAVFIFQIGSTLTTASASSVVLINGGEDCNVYWQIGSSAVLGTGTDLAGSIVALTSITLNTGASVSGRVLARNGAVTLDTSTVTVCPVDCAPITLTPAVLPLTTQGVAFSVPLTASGGVAPYTFSLSAGALPPGTTISAGGVIAGTPTTPGTYAFTVTAVDSVGCAVTQDYIIVVAPAPCGQISISPTTLPTVLIDQPFTQALIASGGTAPYTFALTVGALPPGLLMSPQGVIAGTPDTLGNFSFTVLATDAAACPSLVTYNMVITSGQIEAIALPALSTWTLILLALLIVAIVGWQRRTLAMRSTRR